MRPEALKSALARHINRRRFVKIKLTTGSIQTDHRSLKRCHVGRFKMGDQRFAERHFSVIRNLFGLFNSTEKV